MSSYMYTVEYFIFTNHSMSAEISCTIVLYQYKTFRKQLFFECLLTITGQLKLWYLYACSENCNLKTWNFRWYHGRLDRTSAEERLQHTGQRLAYLIRESERKPGSYVLSFSGKTGISHFRFVQEILKSFLRLILRIRIFTIWNVLKSPQFCPI